MPDIHRQYEAHSEELRGLVVGHNLLDIGGVLFRGNARHSTFSNNCVTNTNKTPILITKWFEANTITGNVFSGRDSEYSPTFGILAETTCRTFVDNTISNNTFGWIRGDGIGLAAEGQKFNSIVGNTFANIGWENPALRAPIRIVGDDATDFAIVGNVFRPHHGGADAMIKTGVIGGFEVVGNAYPRSHRFIVYRDGGNNNIQ